MPVSLRSWETEKLTALPQTVVGCDMSRVGPKQIRCGRSPGPGTVQALCLYTSKKMAAVLTTAILLKSSTIQLLV
ncbi:hypothetical protein NDK43_30475 [Neobacillus pocheonensis]|uniref:Uncharacterized protein n=1 Tax=Neobacillus pocheonensis TaxID=363869 RepID=A0ABT0WHM2_9BACI|nr:hypothetical protein [Neobacillus pocheonensis]